MTRPHSETCFRRSNSRPHILPISSKKLFIYVEDPGAANFVMPLLRQCGLLRWTYALMASGHAAGYLEARGVGFEPLRGMGRERDILVASRSDLLLVGTSENPRSPSFAFVRSAKGEGLTSVAAVDGPANLAERFSGTSSIPLRHAADWLLLTEHGMRGELEDIGFPSERMVVTGHPYFDAIRADRETLLAEAPGGHRAKHLPDAPQGQKVIAFLSEGSGGFGADLKHRSASYALQGWGGSDRRTDIVLEEFLDAAAALNEQPYLVLRLHPKETADTYGPYLHRFNAVSSGGSALRLLCACDLVVGLSTSLLVEAAILGLNTLSILPHDGQRDLILTVGVGITPCATDRGSLRRMLKDQLSAERPSVETIDELIGTDATERAMAALDMIVQLY